MALSSHIEELQKKHQQLATAVEAEQRKPAPDSLMLAQMKKQKLHLKQEIERLGAPLH